MPQLVSNMTSSSDSPSYVSGSMELASFRSYSHKIKLSRSAKPIQACAASVCSVKWGMRDDVVVCLQLAEDVSADRRNRGSQFSSRLSYKTCVIPSGRIAPDASGPFQTDDSGIFQDLATSKERFMELVRVGDKGLRAEKLGGGEAVRPLQSIEVGLSQQ
ncbi:hypothetical protein BDZ89DRAFT_1249972 [Hymenopellis radicata]|nr:hypothetical protein BDZ89DRAFT_1249972 [Hymenopellis radicata]